MESVTFTYSQLDKVHHFCCADESCPTQCSLFSLSCLNRQLQHRLLLVPVSILTTSFIVLSPSICWGLQTHDAPEGLFVHQMAHVLFMAALAYLAWDIHRNTFTGRGWRFLQLFCLFMFLWNGLAFAGHAIAHHLISEDFFTDSTYLYMRLSGPFTPAKLVYYIARLDHLISVPALFFLFLALRTFYHSIETEECNGEDA